MSTFLKGIGIRGYRSFGPDVQYLAPFRKFNFIVGANNSGKSNIITFIHEFLPLPNEQALPSERSFTSMKPFDAHIGSSSSQAQISLCVPRDDFIASCLSRIATPISGNYRQAIETIADALSECGLIWFKTELPYQKAPRYSRDDFLQVLKSVVPERLWGGLWSHVTRQSGGAQESHWIPQTAEWCSSVQDFGLPQIRLIPAIREIGEAGGKFVDYSGKGLIDRLAEIQNPDNDKRYERLIFERVNDFLEEVTSNASAKIEIPHNRAHILVHMDNKILPLSALGTGIHEVVMLAAFCSISQKKIICIEEPELHLHPLLQRKLVKHLNEKTDNQYFVTTHSPSFLDTENAAIFHVLNDGVKSSVTTSILRKQRVSICRDLGHKASDIMQANAILWVEGPSDRIYLRHWISHVDPNLIETTHYSIMFYGGRLLNHLSASDEEVTEFIDLRALNHNLIVMMDSDKKSARDHVNATKLRVASEFAPNPGTSWITAGREIENYIDYEVLQSAIKQLYTRSYGGPLRGGRYDHALHFKRLQTSHGSRRSADDIETHVDKIKVANIVCDTAANLDVLDLKARVRHLVDLIRIANS